MEYRLSKMKNLIPPKRAFWIMITFQSTVKILINADVNASLNIIKKAFGDMAFHGVDRNRYLQSITTWGYYDFYPAKKKILA